MGRADYFKAGDYNARCARCGDKVKAGEILQEWDGYKVCRRCWEPRNAQDLIRPMTDDMAPPWTQHAPDLFLGTTLTANYATIGNTVNIGNTAPLDLGSSGDQGLNVAALKIVVPADRVYTLRALAQVVTTAGGASLRLGMYDDTGTQTFWPTGGAPGALLAQTNAQVLSNGVNSLPVQVPTIITPGGRWINYNQSANVVWTQHNTGIQGQSLFYVAPFAPFDNPFTPGSANDSAIYPVYATFSCLPDSILYADASAGPFTITLCASAIGGDLTILRQDTSGPGTNVLTVQVAGGDTFANGSTSTTIANLAQKSFFPNGISKWQINTNQ